VDSAYLDTDEELARKLQSKFNQEAEMASIKTETQSLTDEEYAQRLQALYLKTDARPKKSLPPRKQDDSKKGDDKPSLWSRLFGPTKPEDSDSDEEELKPMDRKSASTSNPSGSLTVDTTGNPSARPTSVPVGYAYPQHPFMPYYTPYIPLATTQQQQQQQQYVVLPSTQH